MKTSFSLTNIDTLWKLVFRYLRALGRSHHDAEDLTQEVFRHLAAKDFFEATEDRFESELEAHNYLYAIARNVLRDQLRRRTALKRGGKRFEISLDDDATCDVIPINHTTPADEAVRHEVQEHWDHHVTVLASEATARGKQALFVRLQDSLNPSHGPADLKQAANALGMTPVAVRVQASRWRASVLTRVRETMELDQAA